MVGQTTACFLGPFSDRACDSLKGDGPRGSSRRHGNQPLGEAQAMNKEGFNTMNIFGCARLSRPALGRRIVCPSYRCQRCLPFGLRIRWPIKTESSTQVPPPNTPQTPEQLQQLVAPIALYPDSLVAQILAASTFPEQVVEADRWLQAHPELNGDALGKAVEARPWDPSVKALTAFPSVLGNMDKNLSWTSSLGRCLLQPATGCDECHSGDAAAGAGSGLSAKHTTANRRHARLDDRRSAC